jgi:hypothetical protein
MTYAETIAAIKKVCKKINISYSVGGDGRIISAVKEKEYLDALVEGLKDEQPYTVCEIGKNRHWYDIRINGIPINLKIIKITKSSSCNAFQKVAFIYTLTGVEVEHKNMNMNKWFEHIQTMPHKKMRDRKTEYHYLAVDKDTGTVLLKSILDIRAYNSNPVLSNIFQINWKKEFKNIDYVTPEDKYRASLLELFGTVQKSIRQAIAGIDKFAAADLKKLLV